MSDRFLSRAHEHAEIELQAERKLHKGTRTDCETYKALYDDAEAENERLRKFVRDCRDNWDCDADAHRYGTPCRGCNAAILLKELKMDDQKCPYCSKSSKERHIGGEIKKHQCKPADIRDELIRERKSHTETKAELTEAEVEIERLQHNKAALKDECEKLRIQSESRSEQLESVHKAHEKTTKELQLLAETFRDAEQRWNKAECTRTDTQIENEKLRELVGELIYLHGPGWTEISASEFDERLDVAKRNAIDLEVTDGQDIPS